MVHLKSNGIIDNRSLMDRVSGWYFFKDHITTNFYTKSEGNGKFFSHKYHINNVLKKNK
jgi:hypothetical protein